MFKVANSCNLQPLLHCGRKVVLELRASKLCTKMSPKAVVQVDIVSDTVCPWCYVGKKHLEQAALQLQSEGVDVRTAWKPYQLNPSAPMEGEDKVAMYNQKFGAARVQQMIPMMQERFRGLGLEYKFGGLTGNTLNSHRLIYWAGLQGPEKQDALVENLFKAYMCEEKFINDPDVLVAAADAAGLPGARDVVEDPLQYKAEVLAEIQSHVGQVSGVPHFIIGNKLQLSGAQPPQVLAQAIKQAAAA